MKLNEASDILSYFFFQKGRFILSIIKEMISYKIDSSIIQTVKDHGKMLSFDYLFVHNTREISEISVDRPNETST